jgi:lipase chaperone LimK
MQQGAAIRSPFCAVVYFLVFCTIGLPMSSSTLSRAVLWLSVCLIAGAVLGLLLWLKPSAAPESDADAVAVAHQTSPVPSVGAATQSPSSVTIQASQLPPNVTVNGTLPTLAPSLQGTDIDCPLQTDPQGQLVLSGAIRTCFDYFLSSIGEKTEDQLIADIRQYLAATLPSAAAGAGQKLLDQYIAYKHAETRFSGQAAQMGNDAEKLQTLIRSVMQLRRQFFSQPEADALFGREEAFNQYTIKQMQIHANTNLSSAQKASQLAALLDSLPADLAEGIRTSSQYANLQQLTQTLKAEHASPAQLQDMRTRLVGAEAAQRLGQLDTQRAAWRDRIDRYLEARQQVISRLPAGADRDRAISTLRTQTFSEGAEQTRAQAYETMHDQGEKMPD